MERRMLLKPAYSLHAHIAREYLRTKKVFRYHLKKIADMTDDEVIRACHWWYTEQGLENEYRSFEAVRIKEKNEA